jgi:hypothetical protein
VEVRSTNPSIQVRLVNASGMQLSTVLLSGDEVKAGELDMTAMPSGMYLLRIHEGSKVYTKKLSKIK